VDAEARNVPAGIYYLLVRANGSKPRFDEYRIDIEYVSECGNAIVEGDETCDGTAGCTGCQRVPDCGDGFVDAPAEGCEDTGPDDGCDEQCLPEYVSEVEPNESNDDALSRATGDGLVITQDTLLGGSISTPQDEDRFLIRTATDSIVFISTFDTASAVTCDGTNRISTFLVDEQDQLLRGYWPFECAFFAANVPAGDHFLDLAEPLGSLTIPTHRVEIDFVDSVGTEVEPSNNTAGGATAVELERLSTSAFTGSMSDGDEDWYSTLIPARHELVVDTLPDDWTRSTCEYTELDTAIVVYDEFGARLGANSITDEYSYCGKVAVPNRLNEPQRLYVRVTTGDGWSGDFDYRAVFKVRHADLR
jgi:hypothetical protein